MQSTPKVIGKASTRNSINPDGAEMRRYEKELEDDMTKALKAWFNYLTKGLVNENPYEILTRFNSPESGAAVEAVLEDHIVKITSAGFLHGERVIERKVLGIKQIPGGFNETSQLNLTVADWENMELEAYRWAMRYADEVFARMERTRLRAIWIELNSYLAKIGAVVSIAWMVDRLWTWFTRIRAENVAITETTAAFGRGTLFAGTGSGLADLHQWFTQRDERVCPICGGNAGQVVKIGQDFRSGHAYVPGHARCRCWTVLVV